MNEDNCILFFKKIVKSENTVYFVSKVKQRP